MLLVLVAGKAGAMDPDGVRLSWLAFSRRFSPSCGTIRHAALVILQLRLEAFKWRKGIGGGTGETAGGLAVVQTGGLWASLFMPTLPSVTSPSPPMARPQLCRKSMTLWGFPPFAGTNS